MKLSGNFGVSGILAKEDEFEERYSYPNTKIAEIAIKIQTVQAFPRLWFELLAVTTVSYTHLTLPTKA